MLTRVIEGGNRDIPPPKRKIALTFFKLNIFCSNFQDRQISRWDTRFWCLFVQKVLWGSVRWDFQAYAINWGNRGTGLLWAQIVQIVRSPDETHESGVFPFKKYSDGPSDDILDQPGQLGQPGHWKLKIELSSRQIMFFWTIDDFYVWPRRGEGEQK